MSVTKTVPNVPGSADILYVIAGGTRANLMNNGRPATVPGFVATKQEPRYADAALYAEYQAIWDELDKEAMKVGENFVMNVLLYDETEDFRDVELKYPFRERRTQLGSFTLDTSITSYATATSYMKKSEVCEETPDWSKSVSKVAAKGKEGEKAVTRPGK